MAECRFIPRPAGSAATKGGDRRDALSYVTIEPFAGTQAVHVRTRVAAPLQWSAEKPNLYRLTVELRGGWEVLELIERNIGFRDIEVRGRQVYLNGRRVKLAGACHHEMVAGLVCVTVMAMDTGGRKGPDDLADYADTLSQPQLRALNFRRDQHTGLYRCPKRTTFVRLLAGVDAGVLEQILLEWQQRLTGPIQDNLVIIDGKKMRHGGVEMVNATNGQGQFLGGVMTESKSNEIPAAGWKFARRSVWK